MSAVGVVRDALNASLDSVAGLRVYSDIGAVIDPPGTVVGPPSLMWEAMCSHPTSARFLVYVVVAGDERALDNLWSWVELVTSALEAVENAVVIRADPGTFNSGGSELPCYEISVEVGI